MTLDTVPTYLTMSLLARSITNSSCFVDLVGLEVGAPQGHRKRALFRAGLQPPDFTRLTKNAVEIVMARAIDFAQPGRWLAQDTIGYLRTGQGSEIDLSPVSVPASSGPQLTAPLETKWVSQGWRPKRGPSKQSSIAESWLPATSSIPQPTFERSQHPWLHSCLDKDFVANSSLNPRQALIIEQALRLSVRIEGLSPRWLRPQPWAIAEPGLR